jgi:hypothetical protein
MKWIGQHIYDLVSRFRNDVYLEDIDTGTIASGGNLGLDSNNKIVKAAEAAGDIEGVTAGTNLTGGGTSGTVTLNLADASTSAKGAASFASADFDVSSGAVSLKDESIVFDYLEGNLIQTSGESFADNDTSIMTSAAIQDKIYGTTTVGTIGTGVWAGTAIATDQQKHLANFEFEGFSVGDGANYMIPEINSDTKAPFEHQGSTGSDGLTATAVIRLLRTSGHVMPYAGTLKLWKGWATSSGTGQTVDIGIYKVTLVNNDATAVSPVALKNTSFTSVGNAKALTFAETSFSVDFAAGDILISAIRNGTNAKKCEFTSMLVVEWD